MKPISRETIQKYTLAQLCSLLAEANINVYHYENKKWWSRKNKTSSSDHINSWDLVSRTWNEQRSLIKNQIDSLIKELLTKKINQNSLNTDRFLYQVLPISLMIDMLIIENIKIYDLTLKKDKDGIEKATSRKKALEKTLEDAFLNISVTGSYELNEEARTF